MISIMLETRYRIWETACTDEFRPMLTYVCFGIKDGNGYAIAADGKMMAVVPCKIEGLAPGKRQIVPAKAIKRFVTEAGKKVVEIGFTIDPVLKNCTCYGKTGLIIESLGLGADDIEAEYPDVMDIIPENYAKAGTTDRFCFRWENMQKSTLACGGGPLPWRMIVCPKGWKQEGIPSMFFTGVLSDVGKRAIALLMSVSNDFPEDVIVSKPELVAELN
jgi:hypothetical protein